MGDFLPPVEHQRIDRGGLDLQFRIPLLLSSFPLDITTVPLTQLLHSDGGIIPGYTLTLLHYSYIINKMPLLYFQ